MEGFACFLRTLLSIGLSLLAAAFSRLVNLIWTFLFSVMSHGFCGVVDGAWQREQAYKVHRQHGHQDSVRCGEAQACCAKHGRSRRPWMEYSEVVHEK